MTSIRRTGSDDPEFKSLVAQLDAMLSEVNGTDDGFYRQFNHIETLPHVVVAVASGAPVGCGALRALDSATVELKRMYVVPSARGNGVGAAIVTELEDIATSLGFTRIVLETCKVLAAANRLYAKCGFVRTANYGPYVGVTRSLCYEKILGTPYGAQLNPSDRP